MHRLDPPRESPRPSRADRLRGKAARSLRASLITGFLALSLFVLSILVLLGCFLVRIDPITHPALVLYFAIAIPATPLLALACRIFSLRHITLLRMAEEKEPPTPS